MDKVAINDKEEQEQRQNSNNNNNNRNNNKPTRTTNRCTTPDPNECIAAKLRV